MYTQTVERKQEKASRHWNEYEFLRYDTESRAAVKENRQAGTISHLTRLAHQST